jgi:hypothetical protein
MNRRQALTRLAIIPGLLIPEAGNAQATQSPSKRPARPQKHVVYLDQSGVFGKGGFTLAMLVVNDPAKLHEKIASLRDKHDFRLRLSTAAGTNGNFLTARI